MCHSISFSTLYSDARKLRFSLSLSSIPLFFSTFTFSHRSFAFSLYQGNTVLSSLALFLRARKYQSTPVFFLKTHFLRLFHSVSFFIHSVFLRGNLSEILNLSSIYHHPLRT
jgi:hypothetical protein